MARKFSCVNLLSSMILVVQIKVLLMAVKDFNADSGDSSYTMGIVDLLLECVELSYRPGRLKVEPFKCWIY